MSGSPDDVLAGGQPEVDELQSVSERLAATRPLPSPAFRGELQRITVAEAGRVGSRRRWASLLAGTGTALLAVTVLGLAGIGPFAA